MTWRWVRAGGVLLALLAWYAADVGSGCALTSGDDFGYASATVDLSTGASLVHHLDSPAFNSQYVAIGGVPGAYASKYPLGVSLLLVPFYLMGGFRALFALGPLMAVLGVLTAHDLAWQLTRRRAVALLTAALVATLPTIAAQASVIGSDLPSMTMLVATLAVYVRYLERPRAPIFWLCAALAGACFLMRSPNLLLAVGIGVHQLVLARCRPQGRAGAWLGGLVVFGAFVAVQLGANLAVFASWLGGYSHEAGAGGGLTLAYLPTHLPRYLVMLCAVPLLGLPALLAVTARRRAEGRGIFVVLAALVAMFTLFYSAWWAISFDPTRAFVAGERFLVPIMPIVCLFLAVAACDPTPRQAVRTTIIVLCLLGQLGGRVALTVGLRPYKARMAAHRDAIYAATAPDALVVGPLEWAKLLFPHDGTGQVRAYASFEGAPSTGELVRVIDAALATGAPAYLLGSGSRHGAAEGRAAAALRARYHLVTVADLTTPYELRVDRIEAR